MIDDGVGDGIVEQAVDGEVTAEGILLCGGESDGLGVSSVNISSVGAEGSDLKGGVAEEHADHAERFSDGVSAWEKPLDISGFCRSCDVDIVAFTGEEAVADATTCEERFESCVAEAAHDAGGVFDEIGGIHAESGSVEGGRVRVKSAWAMVERSGDGGFAGDGELFDPFAQGCAGNAEEFCGADLVSVGDAHGVEGELAFEPWQELGLGALFCESEECAYGLFAGDFAGLRERIGWVGHHGHLSERNILWEKHIRGGQYAGALDGVLEFAHVARP